MACGSTVYSIEALHSMLHSYITKIAMTINSNLVKIITICTTFKLLYSVHTFGLCFVYSAQCTTAFDSIEYQTTNKPVELKAKMTISIVDAIN